MRLPRSPVRPYSLTAALGLALLLLAPAQAGLFMSRGGDRPAEATQAPPAVAVTTSVQADEPVTRASARARPKGTEPAADRLSPFRGLGTWVDLYDQQGKRLYGFCALSKPADLNQLYFALEQDVIPPSWIYVEMTDRQTNTKYKSNLADTSN